MPLIDLGEPLLDLDDAVAFKAADAETGAPVVIEVSQDVVDYFSDGVSPVFEEDGRLTSIDAGPAFEAPALRAQHVAAGASSRTAPSCFQCGRISPSGGSRHVAGTSADRLDRDRRKWL